MGEIWPPLSPAEECNKKTKIGSPPNFQKKKKKAYPVEGRQPTSGAA